VRAMLCFGGGSSNKLVELVSLLWDDRDGLAKDAAEIAHAGVDASDGARDRNCALRALPRLVPRDQLNAVVFLQLLVGLTFLADDHGKLGVVEQDAEIPLAWPLGTVGAAWRSVDLDRPGGVGEIAGVPCSLVRRRIVAYLLPAAPRKLGVCVEAATQLSVVDDHGAEAKVAGLLQRATEVAVAATYRVACVCKHEGECENCVNT
jgi:hypothetical protein